MLIYLLIQPKDRPRRARDAEPFRPTWGGKNSGFDAGTLKNEKGKTLTQCIFNPRLRDSRIKLFDAGIPMCASLCLALSFLDDCVL